MFLRHFFARQRIKSFKYFMSSSGVCLSQLIHLIQVTLCAILSNLSKSLLTGMILFGDYLIRFSKKFSAKTWAVAFIVTAGVSLLNPLVWMMLNPSELAPEISTPIKGMAYNVFQRWDDPSKRQYPSYNAVDADLVKLSALTRDLRVYSSSELPELPKLAQKHGFQMTLGAWLDSRSLNNVREIEALKQAIIQNSNVNRVIVGNEVLLRGDVSLRVLINYLNDLRRFSSIPVSTAEPWHIWFQYPELVRHVDFITVHLLPYWEGVPAKESLAYLLRRLDQLQRRYPDKKILIGEVGWPSHGHRIDGAIPGNQEQALFIREFTKIAEEKNLDYFLMEAVDQPWKRSKEGLAGAYWGVFDAARVPKFPWKGPVNEDFHWLSKAVFSSILAFFPLMLFSLIFSRIRLPSRLVFATLIQGTVSLCIWFFSFSLQFYLTFIDWISLLLFLPLIGILFIVLLSNGFEFVELFWVGNLRRNFGFSSVKQGDSQPRVSIHLACCNEPPDMVIATMDSLRGLDYENYEVLIIDNNTQDESLWFPVQKHAQKLGERFKFFHLPQWPGFKAGALNFALSKTDPNAEIIGVVDADYVVKSHWLSSLVGHFSNPKVGIVQSPQAHRDWESHIFRRMMNFEYEGFFRVGMHHRNERDAIIQHGTMTLIRAHALRDYGKWAEWTICEDAELGLRLMYAGFSTVYVDSEMGAGLTPDDFSAFRKQRCRWAQGAVQILKKHWPILLGWSRNWQDLKKESVTIQASESHDSSIVCAKEPSRTEDCCTDAKFLSVSERADNTDRTSLCCKEVPGRIYGLTLGQRFHFLTGWLSWIGDALHLFFVALAMLWTIGRLGFPEFFEVPLPVLMIPFSILFLEKVLLGPMLYWRRVHCSGWEIFGAALAGLGLSHAIARGVWLGFFGRKAVFEVTKKGMGSIQERTTQEPVDKEFSVLPSSVDFEKAQVKPRIRPNGYSVVREEAFLLAGLTACALGTAVADSFSYTEAFWWIGILSLQSLPYIAGLACTALSQLPEDHAQESSSLEVLPVAKKFG